MTEEEAKTKAEALNALADRVEREEPSRHLDELVYCATEDEWVLGAEQPAPEFTTSLDAAVTLVPPEYANAWSAGDNSGEHRIFGRLGYEHEATGLTPAAALTAAALRARAEQARAVPSPEQKGSK